MQEPLHFQGREFLFNGIISSIKIKQSPLSKIFALFLLLSTVSIARAQIDGICVCSPTIYQWSLNFTATCPPNNISQGRNAGISDSVCLIFAEQATVTDLVPVRTTTIQFFELNRNLEAINAVFRDGLSLVSGDTFRYTSIIASEPNPVSTRIPGGFQMRITSENANGDKIINDWIVAYTNSCEVEPFEGGGQDSLGWAVFVSLDFFGLDFSRSDLYPDLFFAWCYNTRKIYHLLDRNCVHWCKHRPQPPSQVLAPLLQNLQKPQFSIRLHDLLDQLVHLLLQCNR